MAHRKARRGVRAKLHELNNYSEKIKNVGQG